MHACTYMYGWMQCQERIQRVIDRNHLTPFLNYSRETKELSVVSIFISLYLIRGCTHQTPIPYIDSFNLVTFMFV